MKYPLQIVATGTGFDVQENREILENITSYQLSDEIDSGKEFYFTHWFSYIQLSHNFLKDHVLMTTFQFFN